MTPTKTLRPPPRPIHLMYGPLQVSFTTNISSSYDSSASSHKIATSSMILA